MSLKITVRDAKSGAVVDLNVEDENTVGEIIEGVARYWQVDAGASMLRHGEKVLGAEETVAEAAIQDGDMLDLVHER